MFGVLLISVISMVNVIKVMGYYLSGVKLVVDISLVVSVIVLGKWIMCGILLFVGVCVIGFIFMLMISRRVMMICRIGFGLLMFFVIFVVVGVVWELLMVFMFVLLFV